MELVLPAAGVVDEIRISKGLRYGPFVPKGATNPSMIIPQSQAEKQPTVGTQHLETSEKDLDAKRKEMLSPIPEIKATYVLGAGLSKSAWEGMAE